MGGNLLGDFGWLVGVSGWVVDGLGKFLPRFPLAWLVRFVVLIFISIVSRPVLAFRACWLTLRSSSFFLFFDGRRRRQNASGRLRNFLQKESASPGFPIRIQLLDVRAMDYVNTRRGRRLEWCVSLKVRERGRELERETGGGEKRRWCGR